TATTTTTNNIALTMDGSSYGDSIVNSKNNEIQGQSSTPSINNPPVDSTSLLDLLNKDAKELAELVATSGPDSEGTHHLSLLHPPIIGGDHLDIHTNTKNILNHSQRSVSNPRRSRRNEIGRAHV